MEGSGDHDPAYLPMMPNERVEILRRWHENALEGARRTETITTTFLGRTFVVPPEVIPPNPMGLGESVLLEVRENDRVLDMGTGCGVNGILAASKSRQVVAVDVNPIAVECAKGNAKRNGVANRVVVRESDIFQNLSGKFDLILFDPPFRWFRPRDLFERATADENYLGLASFFRQTKGFLAPGGRILLFFGTSGDVEYLGVLIRRAGLQSEELERVEGEKDGVPVAYFVLRLTDPAQRSSAASPGIYSGRER